MAARTARTLPTLAFDAPPADALAADAPLWRLYDETFPSTEREPPEVILTTVRRTAGMVVRARIDDGTVGFASTHFLRNPSAVFMVYMAVAPAHRGAGIGGRLFEEAWTSAAARHAEAGAPPLGAVWEVESPEHAPDEQARRQRLLRIAFFERLGARVLDQPYLQPPVDGVSHVPMRLMFRAAPATLVDEDDVKIGIVRAIYFEKYGALNGISRDTLDRLLEASCG